MTSDSQTAPDDRNAGFWDELCGSSLARQLGVDDASAESLPASTPPTWRVPLPAVLPDRKPLAGARTARDRPRLRDPERAADRARRGATRRWTSPRARWRWCATGCGSRDGRRSRARGPGLGSGAAHRQRALRLRLHDRLPSPHRRHSARGDRGPPRAAAGRNRGGDALQPLLARQLMQRADCRPCCAAAARRRQAAACTTPTPPARPRPTPTTSRRARRAPAVRRASTASPSTRATSTTCRFVPRRAPARATSTGVLGLDLYITARK